MTGVEGEEIARGRRDGLFGQEGVTLFQPKSSKTPKIRNLIHNINPFIVNQTTHICILPANQITSHLLSSNQRAPCT